MTKLRAQEVDEVRYFDIMISSPAVKHHPKLFAVPIWVQVSQ